MINTQDGPAGQQEFWSFWNAITKNDFRFQNSADIAAIDSCKSLARNKLQHRGLPTEAEFWRPPRSKTTKTLFSGHREWSLAPRPSATATVAGLARVRTPRRFTVPHPALSGGRCKIPTINGKIEANSDRRPAGIPPGLPVVLSTCHAELLHSPSPNGYTGRLFFAPPHAGWKCRHPSLCTQEYARSLCASVYL